VKPGASVSFMVHAAGNTASNMAAARLEERCLKVIDESIREMPAVYSSSVTKFPKSIEACAVALVSCPVWSRP
jgi:hypothetical protein